MEYVIGIDLGTSSVKALLVNKQGKVYGESSKSYPLLQEHAGWSEQDPETWFHASLDAISQLVSESGVAPEQIRGMSFSGQMHGLVLLDDENNVIRNAILWNDTRTTMQCRKIDERLGDSLFIVAKNRALEGFTLPKLLWVKDHEPGNFSRMKTFLLPKDYLRYRLTGTLSMEPSDAAGTIMFDIAKKQWSSEILTAFELPDDICPPVIEADECVGTLLPSIATNVGLHADVRVFAGGADNACGAIGAGILSHGLTMCSIGTSGVILHHEEDGNTDYKGKLHFFNHAQRNAFYSMGVTLAAGYSLSWFKETFAPTAPYEELLAQINTIPAGSEGLLFTPYLVGERTPHADPNIRGSFIGVSADHSLNHFTRAVVEGITFSLRDTIEIMREEGSRIEKIISIGGGAKSETWLQIQADVFNSEVVRLDTEQGPALGAAMIAAVGCQWYDTLEQCAAHFLKTEKSVQPIPQNVAQYNELYKVYSGIYENTRKLNEQLQIFRK